MVVLPVNRAGKGPAERRGRRAEGVAPCLLRLKGYSILAQRLRTPFGEIDIVAQRGRTGVTFETKDRRDPHAVTNAVTPHQRRRIEHAASSLIAYRRDLAACHHRFDLMIVQP